MRIAVISPGYGKIFRGIETVVNEVFTRLSIKYNYKIDIYTAGNSTENRFINTIKIPSIDYRNRLSDIYEKTAKKLNFTANEKYDFEFLTFSFFLLPKLLKYKYDIIFNEAGLYTGKICRLYRWLNNTPYIHSGHSGMNDMELKIVSGNPDYYIVSSPPAEEWIKRYYPGLKVKVIPNGIDFNLFKPEKVENIYQIERPIFLFAGELQKQKRAHLLVESVSRLKRGSLILIGSGSEKDYVLGLCRAKLKNRFIHKDFVDFSELPYYFNLCDYFIMPSKGEAFGIVYIMAMGCNKPVLADNSKIQEWIIEDAGITCDCENIEEFVSAIKKMISTDFGKKPFERSRYFCWDRIVNQYNELILEAVM